MIGWLYRILVGRFRCCDHTWEVHATYKVTERHLEGQVGQDYVLRCTKCGDLTVRRIRP